MYNKNIYVNRLSMLKCHLWYLNVYFGDHNIMQRKKPMELNFECLEIQKWNITMDRLQRVDKKWGNLSRYSQIMVVKMSKIAHFLYLLLMTVKSQLQYGQNI